MENRLDIIIFGATGFTGKRTIPKLTELIKSENLSLTWGISGRKKDKLKEALSEMEQKTGEDFSKIPIICADVNDRESMENMTAQAKVILNAVGPYRLYGEQVVQACIKTGTHHLDVSGEPYFVDTILPKYDQAAKEQGVYLISTCGFDSIPADLGAVFLQQNFEGTLNSIETYMHVTEEGGPYKGASGHYGTYESAIREIEHSSVSDLWRLAHSKSRQHLTPKLLPKGPIFKSDILNKWTMVFTSIDRSVLSKTQKYMQETYNRRPAQIQTYVCFSNLFYLLLTAVAVTIFTGMCKLSFTRYLLLQYPKLFTCGIFSHEGPTEEKQENMYLSLVLHGKGWNEKLSEPTDSFTSDPDKTIVLTVSGNSPYGLTGIAFALSAIMILTERDKMPKNGGCYTPGAAFENTSMIKKLNKHGLKFELSYKL